MRRTNRADHTRPYHAMNRTGLVALLAGESLARAFDRVLLGINEDGRRVVFVVRDSWSIWRYLGVLLLTLLTIGLWSRAPGYLVIAERRGEVPKEETDSPDPWAGGVGAGSSAPS